MADSSAVLAYILVKHMKEACYVFFSMHSVKPWRRELLQKMIISHDKRILIFLFFGHLLEKSSIILSLQITALCGWQVALKWVSGSNFIKIGQKIWSKLNFEHFFWKKFLRLKKRFFLFRILFQPGDWNFCIFKNITPWVIEFVRGWCFSFFWFLIFYAKIKF